MTQSRAKVSEVKEKAVTQLPPYAHPHVVVSCGAFLSFSVSSLLAHAARELGSREFWVRGRPGNAHTSVPPRAREQVLTVFRPYADLWCLYRDGEWSTYGLEMAGAHRDWFCRIPRQSAASRWHTERKRIVLLHLFFRVSSGNERIMLDLLETF